METIDRLHPGDAERRCLEDAHHEICTALTVLRSNVDLVRVHLRRAGDPGPSPAVQGHLDALDGAVDRLRGIAAELRQWHDRLGPPLLRP